MLSLNTEVLSEREIRGTVARHRSQCVNTEFLVFRYFSRETCTGLGKAVPSVPPLLRVPPVIHFALLTVQLGLSLENKLVSFEINIRYSYEHSSLQALFLVGTGMRDQAWPSPPALNQHFVHLET